MAASEGELNSMVQEYLSYHSFEKAVGAFERECAEKGRPLSSSEVRPKTGQRLTNVQHKMIEMLDGGNGSSFFELWTRHLPSDVYDNDPVAQKLEFLLNVYFTTYPIKNGINDKESMVRFRKYLDTRGNALSHTPEFAPYCALAFVCDLKHIPSFSYIFSDTWTENIKTRLQQFLSLTLLSKLQPRLVDLFQGNAKSIDSQMLEQRVKELEKMTELFRKRCTEVEGEYYNLIDVTANLFDTLESCIEGKQVSLDYIPQICNRLFAQDVCQTKDFSRLGTAANVLRDMLALHPEDEKNPSNVGTVPNFKLFNSSSGFKIGSQLSLVPSQTTKLSSKMKSQYHRYDFIDEERARNRPTTNINVKLKQKSKRTDDDDEPNRNDEITKTTGHEATIVEEESFSQITSLSLIDRNHLADLDASLLAPNRRHGFYKGFPVDDGKENITVASGVSDLIEPSKKKSSHSRSDAQHDNK